MLVERSKHWNETRYVKKNKKKEIGIMVDRKFFLDDAKRVICWPVIHWEGQVVSSMSHPVLVAPYRKSVRLPEMEMTEE
jgi:hypothetical protein